MTPCLRTTYNKNTEINFPYQRCLGYGCSADFMYPIPLQCNLYAEHIVGFTC